MNNERINNLKLMLETDPQDTFARYALGLEYLSANEPEIAKNYFEEIYALDPNYLAIYYQLGKVYELLGENDKAKKIYEKGIYVAVSHADIHTKSELEQALNEL